MGAQSADPAILKVVACRLHLFNDRENFIQRAWHHDPFDFRGGHVSILPDLSRAILQRRALLRPLLEAIKRKGGTYRWGSPFHLIVRRGDCNFTLRGPADFQAFNFMDLPAMPVPNWLTLYPAFPRRPKQDQNTTRTRRRRASEWGRRRVELTSAPIEEP